MAVEAFDLAVGLRPVDAGELAVRAEVGQGLLPGEAFAVGPGVVGQDPLDAVDAAGGEEGRGPAQEGCAGGGLLVGVDLAVGQAGMVIDGGVDVVEAHAVAPGAAGLAAQDLVSAAVGDAAEFLDVDVDQFTGPVAFVAADELSGGAVQEGESVQAVPDQDAVDGRGGQAEDRADACGSELAALAQSADAGFGCGSGSVRCRVWAAGAVDESAFALGSPAPDPLVGGGAGDAHLSGDVCDGTA